MSENWPKSRRTNRRLVKYALIGIPLATLFLSHRYYEWYNLSNAYIIAIINQIKTYDYGNAIAVLLGVGGYLLENYFQRKTAREEKQMDRVEQQSHKLLVPVTGKFIYACVKVYTRCVQNKKRAYDMFKF